ncbi:hypothetical protein [Fibrobacter sp. UWB10]|uniref:hypothetical protein n=1 Tax=Fibrobacter sp. UWB10 TaxID=1896201 RepID=UPI002402DE41|nr:hypothetical protein [Fibrobacter sp. UWB10]SMP57676.1 hypothetical protein SAMN05720465_2721 [Fibrobacter sp. UWB10]
MKKILLTSLICSMSAFAWIPGVCDIGDARQDSFGKAQDYFIIDECAKGQSTEISLPDFTHKVYWCSCYTGALACYFGKDIEKLKKANSEELKKADEKATKLADKCYLKMIKQ